MEGSSFREVCEAYYKLFDVPIRVFDKEGNVLAEVTGHLSPCRYVNKFEKGRKECTGTRLRVKKNIPEKGLAGATCVCGLQYAAAPIYYQNAVVGKVVLGPYLPVESEGAKKEKGTLGGEFEKDELERRIGSMRQVSKKAIEKIVNAIMSVVDVVLFASHKAHVTSQIHLSSIRESYKELAEKNRELESMHEQMREFERLKANFLSTVSHELRTPLTSIIGYSDMLAEGIAGELDPEQQQFVLTIKDKGDELLRLISSILDFSRIETGHLDIRWTKTDPKELIEEAADEADELAKRRGIRLSVDIPELPPVWLDPEKIRGAIDHVIENAVKFSTPQGVVKIGARMLDPDEEELPDEGFGFVLMASPKQLEIFIEDYGIGIAEGDQGEIWAPFAQLDNSSTREHGGAGLGLAVVKHYVEAHGGQVLVNSNPGEGSKFMIRIPVVDRD